MTAKRAPPQLIFDDGSRIMTEESSSAMESSNVDGSALMMIRGSTPLEVYYEIDRIAQEIVSMFPPNEGSNDSSDSVIRIALQFPDELLRDSPEVCWLLEEKLQQQDTQNQEWFVFCLGDTTVGSCCPDEVAGLHLQANVLVHYGHACLSPTGKLPVIYSFGTLKLDVPTAVQRLKEEVTKSKARKFLLLYQVGYHHAMKELQKRFTVQGDVYVVAGQIPRPTTVGIQTIQRTPTCCGGGGGGGGAQASDACCGQQSKSESCNEQTTSESTIASDLCIDPTQERAPEQRSLIVGGLELPESILSWEQLCDYTVIFIGDPESTCQRQYVNIMLRFLSLPTPPKAYWTYSPESQSLSTEVPVSLQRQLKRRFFLTQKARDAHVFGILVSNLSQQHLVRVVKILKGKIQDAGKASYSFSVGKINPNKLANFAEIECFVLVACRENSLLDMEREYYVPVITPLELDIALGNLTWGGQAYSLDCQDILPEDLQKSNGNDDKHQDSDEGDESFEQDNDDEDAPYFSLVTGQYVQRTNTNTTSPLDLEHLPGKGQVTAYKSEAANFLKQREYKGLATLAGQTEATAAIAGQSGIASDYGGS